MSEQQEARREITLGELEAAQKRGDRAFLASVQAEGIVKVFDKDGKLKSEMKITSIEVPPTSED